MPFLFRLQCVGCGRQYSTRVPYTCPACGITGILDAQYDYAAVRRVLSRKVLARRSEHSLWRYRELLQRRKHGARGDRHDDL